MSGQMTTKQLIAMAEKIKEMGQSMDDTIKSVEEFVYAIQHALFGPKKTPLQEFTESVWDE